MFITKNNFYFYFFLFLFVYFFYSAQEERAERRKLRQQLQEHLGMEKEPLDRIAPSLDNPYLGTYDTDPTTTNLFLSNLNPKVQ